MYNKNDKNYLYIHAQYDDWAKRHMCSVRLQFSKWWWVVSVLSILLPLNERQRYHKRKTGIATDYDDDGSSGSNYDSDGTIVCIGILAHWYTIRKGQTQTSKRKKNLHHTNYGIGLNKNDIVQCACAYISNGDKDRWNKNIQLI